MDSPALTAEIPTPPGALLEHWRARRTQVLRTLDAPSEQLDADESGAAAALPAEKQAELQRRLFLASRQVGLKAIEPLEVVFEPVELGALLQRMPDPCFSGTWTADASSGAVTLTRAGCGRSATPARCDYWREAVDGLVMGLGEDARYARHRSQGHGDATCVDVWYEGSASPLQFGPLPEALADALARTEQQLATSGVILTVQGFSEGTLYYRLKSVHGPACGPGGVLLRGLVKHALDQYRPGLNLVETTPQGVLGTES